MDSTVGERFRSEPEQTIAEPARTLDSQDTSTEISNMSATVESRLAVCSWSLQPEGPDDLFESLDQLECRRIQLALSPLIHEPDRWAGVFDVLEKQGIEVVSGMMAMAGEDYTSLESIARTGGVRPDATWEANREHVARIAEQAAEHDINLVTFHAGFLPESNGDGERLVMLRRLAEIADHFATRSVDIAFETGQESAATLLAVLDELDRQNVGVNFDPANMILYGTGDPIEALRRLAINVRQIHIKDATSPAAPGAWGTEVPVGDGAVDWKAFMTEVLGWRRAVDLVIERESGDHRIEDIARAIKVIREVSSD
ncbi:MAG: sugar phosphate isomerase/epimerase [Phycisphaerales bacterium]|nr:MAG: sugar phosphate isomerase/epimerase [Phycisphaerales bacterium]